MKNLPINKDFEFYKGNTYKMEFESNFLTGSMIALTAKKSNDPEHTSDAIISFSEDQIIATLPNELSRGIFHYDLEVNRYGIITTEYKGSINIL